MISRRRRLSPSANSPRFVLAPLNVACQDHGSIVKVRHRVSLLKAMRMPLDPRATSVVHLRVEPLGRATEGCFLRDVRTVGFLAEQSVYGPWRGATREGHDKTSLLVDAISGASAEKICSPQGPTSVVLNDYFGFG
jgi:hypothetical protein